MRKSCIFETSCFVTKRNALLLLLFVACGQIGAVASTSLNEHQTDQSSILQLNLDPSSILVTWLPFNQNYDSFSVYTVAWGIGGKMQGEVFIRNSEERLLNITGLKPCTTYDVSVSVNNENGTTLESRATTLVKEPPAVLRLSARHITARSLALSWERPATMCEITAYNITYSGVAKWGPSTEHTGSATIGLGDVNSTTTIVIDGLQPYTDYTVTVAASTEAGEGEQSFANATTLQIVPSPPIKLEAASNSTSSITVTWEEPQEHNGLLGPYKVYWLRDGSMEGSAVSTADQFNITGLLPCVEYTVRVVATTGAGEGKSAEAKRTTLPAPPASLHPSCTPNSNTQTILVTWTKPNTSCPIAKYVVSWANDSAMVDNLTLQHTLDDTTREELSTSICVSVMVAEDRGAQACCDNARQNASKKGKGAKITGITLGVVGAIVVAALLLAAILKRDAIRNHLCPQPNEWGRAPSPVRRRKRSSDTPNPIDRFSIHPLSEDDNLVTRRNWQGRVQSDVSTPELIPEEHSMTEETSGMIGAVNATYGVFSNVEYFSKLTAKVKDQLEYLKDPATVAAEFDQLNKESFVGETSAGQLPVNMKKNRYSNIIPFDYNRVRLRDAPDTTTDYINASFVQSLVDDDIDFIACQSPKANTVSDFWWMVWEQNIRIIVMLVRSDEGKTSSAIQYWPVLHEQTFSTLSIKPESKEVIEGLIIRNMILQNEGESRSVQHFQFISWPDFGVPYSENELLMLVKEIREHIEPATRNIIVHCSAGTGRTGAFIALWQLQLQAERRVSGIDIKKTVLELRRHRQSLVQKSDQYYFIHSCFLKYLQEINVWKPTLAGAHFSEVSGLTMESGV